MKRVFRIFYVFSTICVLTACGGGGDTDSSAPTPAPEPTPTPTPTPTPPPTPAPEPSLWQQQVDAARLLNQATFGPQLADIERVVELGAEAWIDEQIAIPTTRQLDYIVGLEGVVPEDEFWRQHRIEAWWDASLFGEDQLRQRVAYALSQIMVISDRSNFEEDIWGIANYYDMLADNAFGNYRDLIEDVTLSPIMGMYLSMMGNEKPDPERNVRPDENYARELMQLFSIGLIELNLDGTPKIGADGQPIETYNQSIIEAYAHVFTGWNFNGTSEETWYQWWRNYEGIAPMTSVEAFHDKGEKQLLNGVIVPANQTAQKDLDMALNSLFEHPNVGPFIAKQLIQRLVTSNPSGDYVHRVASVFNDDGTGERGDLGAVVKAILLDEEARAEYAIQTTQFGKLKEPIIKATQLWRAFGATSPNDRIELGWPDYFFNQAPLSSPSVFNFYLPDYTSPGVLTEQNMVAPELQIMTETFVVRTTNFMAYSALWGHSLHRDPNDEDILVDFAREVEMLEEPSALIEHLDLLLMAGSMGESYRQILLEAHEQTENWEPADRVANLVFLIMSSPQYAVQQ